MTSCPSVFNGQQIVNENFVTSRIDHKFSEKDALFGTYLYDKTPYSSPDSFGNVGLNTLSSRQIFAAEGKRTVSRLPLSMRSRFGYNHENVNNDSSVSAINKAAADTSLAAFSGRNAGRGKCQWRAEFHDRRCRRAPDLFVSFGTPSRAMTMLSLTGASIASSSARPSSACCSR